MSKLHGYFVMMVLVVYGILVFIPLCLAHAFFERLLTYADVGGSEIEKFLERKSG